MKENIDQFLAYCERTGERPELAFMDNKTYLVEWHPNKALKRVSFKLALYEDLEYHFLHKKPQSFYIAKVKYQGTSTNDNKSWKRK